MIRAAVLAVLAVAACSSDPRIEPEQHLPVPVAPTFTLLVSNQSFDLDPVDMRVTLDGQLAVTGDFVVGSQHTWVPFDFDLAPGSHVIEVTTADANAVLAQTFDMDDRKWGVLMFWFHRADDDPSPPRFSWELHDAQPAFD